MQMPSELGKLITLLPPIHVRRPSIFSLTHQHYSVQPAFQLVGRCTALTAYMRDIPFVIHTVYCSCLVQVMALVQR